MSEPEVDGLAAEALLVLDLLDPDRDEIPYPLGMAGGMLVPARLKQAAIRAKAEWRGHVGNGLADVVDVVTGLDVHLVGATRAKLIKEALDRAKTTPGKGRR